jgi:hypothetical protein
MFPEPTLEGADWASREIVWPDGDARHAGGALMALAEWYRQQAVPVDDLVLHLAALRRLGLRWRADCRQAVSAACCEPGNLIAMLLTLRRDGRLPRYAQSSDLAPKAKGKDGVVRHWWDRPAPSEEREKSDGADRRQEEGGGDT